MTTSSRRRVRRPALIIVTVLFLVLALVGGMFAANWWGSRPQGDPEAVEFSAAELSAPLVDARVLALGEATHGNAEFQELRLELTRKMLPHGTRTIVLEEDYGATLRVNDYLRGGEGTAEEAAARFRFRINHTAENARWLAWLREHNDTAPAGQKIQLVGMDVQGVEESRDAALAGLARHDATTAKRLARELADLDEDTSIPTAAQTAAVRELATATAALPGTDPDAFTAQTAARALEHRMDLYSGAYGSVREAAMFDMLSRLVDHASGPVLLFGHNAHVAKAAQGAVADPVGARAAAAWGEGYRVIGTDFIRTEFLSGTRDERRAWTLHNRTPLAGIFAGTTVGYLDFGKAGDTNRELLGQTHSMGSAGERFTRLQQLIPFFHQVTGVPARWYDALVMVTDATPTTMLD